MGDQEQRRVDQATGVIAEQVGCDRDEAVGRLMIRARAMGQNLLYTALDVIDGEIRLGP